MVHGRLAQAAVGVEDVPLDQEGFLFRLRQALEFGQGRLHALVEFVTAELMEWRFSFDLHDFWLEQVAWWSVHFGTKTAYDGSRVSDGGLLKKSLDLGPACRSFTEDHADIEMDSSSRFP